MARRINRRGRKIYDFVDIPPPNNSLFFILRDRRALFWLGEEPHNGTEMHTTAEQYSSQKKIYLFISANQGKCWIAGHSNNLAEAFKWNIHSRSRKSERSRKSKRTNITTSWETYLRNLTSLFKPWFMEMIQLHIGISNQVLRILPFGLFFKGELTWMQLAWILEVSTQNMNQSMIKFSLPCMHKSNGDMSFKSDH